MGFDGFPPEGLKLLKDLTVTANNAKPWFDAHRSIYADCLLEPGRDFVEALTRTIRKLEAAGYRVEGDHYKRVPKGYPADHPRR